jgi:dihydrofolate reductase
MPTLGKDRRHGTAGTDRACAGPTTRRDIALFGGPQLAATLRRHGLIDEYRVLVSPVLLWRGNRAFIGDGETPDRLRLVRSETWSSSSAASR